MDKPIPNIVKDILQLFIIREFDNEFWICYPDEDEPWYLCKASTKEDAEFIKDAIALHCSNFIHKDG